MTDIDAPTMLAAKQAAAAACAAEVRIHTLSELEALSAVEALYGQIWRSQNNPPIGTEMLRALSKAGNYVGAAYAGQTMVGACVGFFAAPLDRTLHSHIAGVLPQAAQHGIGYALKLHQRAWGLQHGVEIIEWTFDPLVARNAYFNLMKLAGKPIEYLPNFYGGMQDQINLGGETDRLLLRWDLNDSEVAAACSAQRPPMQATHLVREGVAVALGRGPSGEPVFGTREGQSLLIAVPEDVERMRVREPELASEWRHAVRRTLGALIADGGRVRAFTTDGWYLMDTGAPDQSRGDTTSWS